MAVDYSAVIYSVLASIAYGALFYLKAEFPDVAYDNIDLKDILERFDYKKFLATLIVGILVGVVSAWQGDVVTPENFQIKMAIYATYIITVENVLKIIGRYLNNRGKVKE